MLLRLTFTPTVSAISLCIIHHSQTDVDTVVHRHGRSRFTRLLSSTVYRLSRELLWHEAVIAEVHLPLRFTYTSSSLDVYGRFGVYFCALCSRTLKRRFTDTVTVASVFSRYSPPSAEANIVRGRHRRHSWPGGGFTCTFAASVVHYHSTSSLFTIRSYTIAVLTLHIRLIQWSNYSKICGGPFPSPPLPLPLPSLFLPLPSPSPPLLSPLPPFAARGLGERSSSPSGSGRSPAAKRFLVLLEL